VDSILDQFMQIDREQSLGLYGIHVYREGSAPIERRTRSDDRVNLYSVAKTFTAVALGMAEAEGRLTLDDKLLDHFPELRGIAADGFEDVTLRQLTTMTSGTSHEWFADNRIDAADLLHEIVAAPLAASPGTKFAYTGSGPYAVGRIIARVTGADLRAYLTPRLFAPLDLHNPAWHTCPLGYEPQLESLFTTIVNAL
jgi:CubicO group peptidase (beta-lactamase class C family)